MWIGAGIVQEKEDSSVLVGCFFSHSFSFVFRDFGRLGEEEEKKGEELVCCVLFFEFDCWSLLCKCVLDLCCLCGESEGVEYSLKQRGLLACLLAAIKSEQVDAVRVRCGSFGGGAIKELSIDQRRFCLFFLLFSFSCFFLGKES